MTIPPTYFLFPSTEKSHRGGRLLFRYARTPSSSPPITSHDDEDDDDDVDITPRACSAGDGRESVLRTSDGANKSLAAAGDFQLVFCSVAERKSHVHRWLSPSGKRWGRVAWTICRIPCDSVPRTGIMRVAAYLVRGGDEVKTTGDVARW